MDGGRGPIGGRIALQRRLPPLLARLSRHLPPAVAPLAGRLSLHLPTSIVAHRPAVIAGAPPLLRGSLDEPLDDRLPRRETTFRGWALAGDDRPSAVELLLDGTRVIRAVIGEPRPDVVQNVPLEHITLRCGWAVDVDLSHWPEGDLDVQVVVDGWDGQRETVAHRTFTLFGPIGQGCLDEPHDGGTVDQMLLVRGWAVAGAHLPSRVDIEVDGRFVGRARLRVHRKDVEAVDPVRYGPLAGFEYRCDLPDSHGECVDVDVTVVARDGSELHLPTRSVRAERTRVTAAEIERADTLRKRTESDAQRILRIPEPDRGSTAGRSLLIFTHSLRLGGAELYLQELLRQLVPTMRRCILVAPMDGGLRQELDEMGVEVLISSTNPFAPDLETHEGLVRELTMLILGSGCDLVMVNTLALWPAADAAARLGIPLIWAIHESFEVTEWIHLQTVRVSSHPFLKARLEATLHEASRLVFEAHATSEIFAHLAPPERRAVIPYGVDIDMIDSFAAGADRDAMRAARGISEDATVLLSMGVTDERKAQACLIEAFAEVATVHSQAVLVLVGDQPTTPYSAVLHKMAADLDLEARIRFVPITPDIYPWYAVADVLVSASDVESLPRSMLEAMAFGVPVLTSDVFGVPELIDHGLSGWLYRSRDMVAMIAALHSVLSLRREQRAEVGEAGRAKVREHHRASFYGRAYEQLIEQLIDEVSAVRR